jgi:hypothetical protein
MLSQCPGLFLEKEAHLFFFRKEAHLFLLLRKIASAHRPAHLKTHFSELGPQWRLWAYSHWTRPIKTGRQPLLFLELGP